MNLCITGVCSKVDEILKFMENHSTVGIIVSCLKSENKMKK